LTSCKVCDTNNSYNFDHTSFNMSLCGICNVSCQCDGYVEPWDEVTQKCAAECGDGVIRVDEECDDNNTDSFDGCSASCIV
jgi:cysteine-rich repeat protein